MATFASLPAEYQNHPLMQRAIQRLGQAEVDAMLAQAPAIVHAAAVDALKKNKADLHADLLQLGWTLKRIGA